MSETVTRMAPGGVEAIEAHQSWALECHEPPSGPERPVDLLFVHGVGGGSWIWPEAWLAAFAEAGYRAWTLTLPGRPGGATVGYDPLVLDRQIAQLLQTRDASAAIDGLLQVLPGASLWDGPTLEDFADALTAALARIGRPTVAVGHSLGGAVLQLSMQQGRAPAGSVLLCSVPPYGLWRASAEMAFTDPLLWLEMARMSLYGPTAVDPTLLRETLFPGGVSNRDFDRMQANLRDESLMALAQTLGLPPFAPPPGPRRDVLVIGGGRDRLVPAIDLHMTAFYYGGVPVFLPEAGHVPMLESAGTAAVRAILDWVGAFDARKAAA